MEHILRGIIMNNKQIVIRLNNAKENFKQLEQIGFCNAQCLTKDNYNFPVIVVDLQSKQFFGTNTTCMAAMKPHVKDIADIIRNIKNF